MANEISAAQTLTDSVRQTADGNNIPYPWTEVYTFVHNRGGFIAVCSDYAAILIKDLGEMNLAGRFPGSQQPQLLNVSFVSNIFDGHTLVQIFNSDDQDWILLDPTFDMSMKRSSDGHWATAQDIHTATVNQTWSAISYVFLGSYGNSLAKGYYLDYPLLYLNVPMPPVGTGADPRPYMTAVSPPSGTSGLYLISSNQTPLQVIIDGQLQTLDCSAVLGFSKAFFANSISLPQGSTAQIQVWRPNRYVF
jgi:hypothetical protein